MFEKSIAVLRVAYPDLNITVALIGGTLAERQAWRQKNLDIPNLGVIHLDADSSAIRSALRGRTLAGAVLFGGIVDVSDTIPSIHNAVRTAAMLAGVEPNALVHDEFVARVTAARDCDSDSKVFMHTDGGLYEFLYEARSSVDSSPVVVYRHLWPFEVSIWVRPNVEWAERFTPISMQEYGNIVGSVDRAHAQAEVTQRRRERKAQKLEDQRAALERLGMSSARVTIGPKPGPVVEQLEGRPVQQGHYLYDAQGHKWLVRGPGTYSYAFKLVPAGTRLPNVQAVWNVNQYDAQGVQQLYWENPLEGLEYAKEWNPALVGLLSGWEIDVPNVGYFQVYKANSGSWALIVPAQLYSNDLEFSKCETANAAMRKAEQIIKSNTDC